MQNSFREVQILPESGTCGEHLCSCSFWHISRCKMFVILQLNHTEMTQNKNNVPPSIYVRHRVFGKGAGGDGVPWVKLMWKERRKWDFYEGVSFQRGGVWGVRTKLTLKLILCRFSNWTASRIPNSWKSIHDIFDIFRP